MTISAKAKSDLVQKLFADAGLEPPDEAMAARLFDAAVELAVLNGEPEGMIYLEASVEQAAELMPIGALDYDGVLRVLQTAIADAGGS